MQISPSSRFPLRSPGRWDLEKRKLKWKIRASGSSWMSNVLLDVKRAGRETCATARGLRLAFWASEELELLAPRQHSGSRCSGQHSGPRAAPGCQTCRPGNVWHCPGSQTSIVGLRAASAAGPRAAFWAWGCSWMSNVQAGKRVPLPERVISLSKFWPRNPDIENCSFYKQDARLF